MKNAISYILIFTTFISCSSKTKYNRILPTKNQDIKTQKSIDKKEVALWADTLIIEYIEKNTERFSEIEGTPVAYFKDTTFIQDKKYAVVNIGHSFDDRFITEQLLYIDSLTKNIYEYNPLTDSLLIWIKH